MKRNKSLIRQIIKPIRYWFLYSFLLPLGFFPGIYIRQLLLPLFLEKCGKRLWVYPNAFFMSPEHMRVGDYVNFNRSVHIEASGGVEIGDYSAFGPFSVVMSSMHNHPASRYWRMSGDTFEGVRIGRDCLIGAHAVLLPGTQLADGCIVTPGAIVRGSFPRNAIIVGNPARLTKYREDLSGTSKEL